MAAAGIRISADALAEVLKVSKWDEIYELNLDYIFEQSSYGVQERIKERIQAGEPPITEKEEEEIRQNAEMAVSDDMYSAYMNALDGTANEYLGEWGLVVNEEKDKKGRRTGNFILTPQRGETWLSVAGKVVETIHGEGMFYFQSLPEFLHSGPFASYKDAVTQHLHWIQEYPKIWGGTRIDDYFSSEFAYYSR